MTRKIKKGLFSDCCAQGAVALPPLEPVPNVLIELLANREGFMPYIRAYNSALSFASIGANVDTGLIERTDGIYTFRIHGTMYHRLGSLLPEPGEQPGFAQLYFYDTDHKVDHRLRHMDKLDRRTVVVLQNMIRNVNRFYEIFQQALNEQSIVDGVVDADVELPGHNIPMKIVEILSWTTGDSTDRHVTRWL